MRHAWRCTIPRRWLHVRSRRCAHARWWHLVHAWHLTHSWWWPSHPWWWPSHARWWPSHSWWWPSHSLRRSHSGRHTSTRWRHHHGGRHAGLETIKAGFELCIIGSDVGLKQIDAWNDAVDFCTSYHTPCACSQLRAACAPQAVG